ncbi:hypothetical protein D3C73_1584180 [compost metagenome]
MDELMTEYNALIKEEDSLYQQIDICKACLDLLIDYVSEKEGALHITTMESIVTTIHIMHMDFETELLHLRLEKGLLNNRISAQRRL